MANGVSFLVLKYVVKNFTVVDFGEIFDPDHRILDRIEARGLGWRAGEREPS
jgi:hypothetical protein